MGGNSKSHPRWRFACDHSVFVDKIPACQDCLSTMKSCDANGLRVVNWKRNCDLCLNWMVRGIDNPALLYKPRDGYPKGYLLGGELSATQEWTIPTGMIRPIELTYKKLTKAMSLTYENIENGIWTTVEGQHYISENVINVELLDKIECQELFSIATCL
jgi:hypothetical protein